MSRITNVRPYVWIALLYLLLAASSANASGWQAQTNADTDNLNAIHCPVNSTTCFAAGALGTVLKTSNGGTAWSSVDPNTVDNLLGVWFVDNSTGYVVGDNGAIWRTTDGGSNWTDEDIGGTLEVNDIHCPTASTCWAGLNGGEIWDRSGGTWTMSTDQGTVDWHGIWFLDDSSGYAIGGSGNSVFTTNGGSTWTGETTKPGATNMFSLVCTDASTCWAAGGSAKIWKTANAGVTWTEDVDLGAFIIGGISFPTSGVGYIAGDTPNIYKKREGETSWSAHTGIGASAFNDIFCTDDKTCYAVGAGGAIRKTTDGGGEPTLLSATSNTYTVGDTATAAAGLVITDGPSDLYITAANDVRVSIPSGFNMLWDTSDTTATLAGTASTKVSSTVSYADSGRTLVIDVTVDFAADNQVQVSDLSFTSFTDPNSADNLEMSVDGGTNIIDEDGSTITIVRPAISSAASIVYQDGDVAQAIGAITVTDASTATITADTSTGDIRIRIPSTFSMTWDTTDTTATILGTASGKVSTTVSYENSDQTLYIDVTSDFAAGETIIISDLSFDGINTGEAADNLELLIGGSTADTAAEDDKTIAVSSAALTYATADVFAVGDPRTDIPIINVINDFTTAGAVSTADNIRIRIPSGFNMIWDTSDTTASFGSSASDKVSGTISYEDSGQTLWIDVTTDFATVDILTITDLGFINFSAASAADKLELIVAGSGTNVSQEASNTVTILAPTLDMAAAATYYVGQVAQAIQTLTITDASTALIDSTNDIRITIPASLNMLWDTSDISATFGGAASDKVSSTISYEGSGKTLYVDVTATFANSDVLTIADLAFASFTAASAADALELVIGGATGTTADEAGNDIRIGAPTIVSAANQAFGVGASATAISAITVTDDATSPSIAAATDLRVRIPSAFNMVWDTTDTAPTFAGTASSKTNAAVTYEDSGKVLVVDMTDDFAAGQTLIISDLKFTSFSASSAADNLELVLTGGANDDTNDEDSSTISIGAPTIVSNANQLFIVGGSTTAIESITVTDDATAGVITAGNDIRVRIPSSFAMTWDTSDTAATITGTASSKVSTTLSYESSDQVLYLNVTSDFAAGETLIIADLNFNNFLNSEAADKLELVIDGSASGDTVDEDTNTITIGQPTLASAANQLFSVNDPIDAIETITITDDATAPTITAASDLRVRIPSSFGMTWDTSDTAATIGGTASSKVLTTVSYESSDQVLWIDVTSDLAAGETITISGLNFTAFTTVEAADNLELVVTGASGITADDDSATITIGSPTIASAANQLFNLGDGITAIQAITATESATAASITAAKDIRIRIPTGFGMTWDNSDTTATITGTASTKVATTVSYESSDSVLWVNVTSDLAAGETVIISGLNFTAFTTVEAADNLELVVSGDGTAATNDEDSATVTIGAPTMASAANQGFAVGDPITAISAVTVTESGTAAGITATGDIRIRIPSGFGMTWDNSDTTATITGTASTKVATTVSYESSDSVLWVNVTTDLAAGETVIISGLNFTAFTTVEAANNLELVVSGNGSNNTNDEDSGTITIGSPTMASAANQVFALGSNATAISAITVTEDGTAAAITASNDIRIRIPTGFGMLWDNSDTTATITGTASAKVATTVSYESSDSVLWVNVTTDLAAGETVIISGLNFKTFSTAEAADNLELVVSGSASNATNDEDSATIAIGSATMASAANQVFALSSGAQSIQAITVTDDATTASITAASDVRIRIPSGFSMTWDTSDTTATIAGTASSKVATTVSYESSDSVLWVNVTTDLAAGETIIISGLNFANFTAVNTADNLELVVTGSASDATNDEDSTTITIAAPTIASSGNQTFSVGDPATAIAPIAYNEDSKGGVATTANDIRIRIPTGFGMLWDTSDTAATINGPNSDKVSATVAYELGGQVLVIDVTTDFATSDAFSISDLKFTSFTTAEAADNLELVVTGGASDTTNDDDSMTIAIGSPTMASAANQTFAVGDPATAISTITVTEDGTTAAITAGNDIRIRIPTGFGMVWDNSDTTATITGTASSKVATTVSYESSDSVLWVNVTSDLAAGETVIISGLNFTTFSTAEAADNLELVVSGNGGNATNDEDSSTISIGSPTMASAANQVFALNDGATAISAITVTDDATSASITASNDIRIRIPSGFSMTWDNSDTTAVITGTASTKVSTTVSYESSDSVLWVNVTTDLAAGETVIISGLNFTAFTVAEAADNLELVVSGNAANATNDEDSATIATGAPTLASAANQAFAVGDSATAISAATVTDGAVATITASNDIRIRIPTGFGMVWDNSDTTATITGTASTKVATTVSYESSDSVLWVNVTTDLAAGETVIISGLNFTTFSTAEAADNLELVVSGNGSNATNDEDANTISIGAPTMLSAANQTFALSGPATAISAITVTDDTNPAITAANDIRIRIPTGFGMVWDNTDVTATITGTASAKVATTVSYEASDSVLWVNVTTDLAASETVIISGLNFTTFSTAEAADNLELVVSGSSGGTAVDDDNNTIAIGAPTMASAANQNFALSDPATAISAITVTDDGTSAAITAGNDIRIRIPTGFGMVWDNTDVTATITGTASSKVATTVSYESSDSVLWVNVTTDLAAGETVIISGLNFTTFSTAEAADNLELVVSGNGGNATNDEDSSTITIGSPTMASAANQTFALNDGATAISAITVTDDATSASITASNDIRIRVPSGFSMTWDNSDVTAVITGTASSKVSTTVSYESSDSVLWVNVTTDLAAGETVIISGLNFTTFSTAEAADNLELVVSGNAANATNDEDSATIAIGAPTLASAANQAFAVGDPITAISAITVTDDATTASITASNDIRIRIPSGFSMTWDNSDVTATITGTGSSKVATTVSYESSDSVLWVNVTTDLAAGETVIISGLNFTSFSTAENADNLELVISGGASNNTNDEDSSTIRIGSPTMASAANQTFTISDPATAISTITVTDDGTSPTITAANDIRIRIPSGFSMTWDNSDVTAVITGTASAKVATTVSYESSDSVLWVNVTTDLAAGETVIISGLNFANFTTGETADNLELVVSGSAGNATNDEDSNTIAIGGATVASAAAQTFAVGDPATAISTITVTEDSGTATITAANDIRIRIPTGFAMEWDTTDVTATITGTASAKVATTVSYESSGQVLWVNVTTDLATSETVIISGLSFTSFTTAEVADNLELVTSGSAGGSTTDEDSQTIATGAPTMASAANQAFAVGDAATAISAITVTDDGTNATITATNDIRIRIPSTFAMDWDTSDVTATITGTASSKVATTVSYESSDQVLYVNVTSDLAAGETVIISGLNFANFANAEATDNLELVISGNASNSTNDADSGTITIGGPTMASAANQSFAVGDGSTTISAITVTEDGTAAAITASNDIRIRIPSGFGMTWDTSDVTAAITGTASAKVATTVSYESSDQVLYINVTTDLATSETLIISGLSFASFTTAEAADNLELVVSGNASNPTNDEDANTILIGSPTLVSAANQTFSIGASATLISAATVTDDGTSATITAANDIRIRIPSGFSMTWDNSDVTATITGTASGKVATTVSYESSDSVLWVNVTTDLAAGETVIISDLSFANFTAGEAADNLELVVSGGAGNATNDEDSRTIAIGGATIASAANQTFALGSPATAIQTLTLTEDSGTATVTAANDIRIRIPTGFDMIWDTTDVTATIGGTASGKVATTVSYESSNKVLWVNVTTDLSTSETVTISGLSFTSFSAGEAADNLELVTSGSAGGSTTDEDAQTIAIGGPTMASAASQAFALNDSSTVISAITVSEDSTTATITAANDIRIRIPSGFAMTWDTTDVTVALAGSASSKVATTVSYESSDQVLWVNVTTDLAASDTLVISGLSYANFTTTETADNLELVVSGSAGNATNDEDSATILIAVPTLSSSNQTFTVGAASTAISAITVTDNATNALIDTTNDIRIQIPSGFSMTWDTSDVTPTLAGSASGKVAATVSYESSGQILYIDVTTAFAAGETLSISALSFNNFTAVESADNLELVIGGSGASAAATDTNTIAINAGSSVTLSGTLYDDADRDRVVDSGEALSGAIVTVYGAGVDTILGTADDTTVGTTTTNGSGAYSIGSISPATILIEVQAANSNYVTQSLVSTLSTNTTQNIRVVIDPAGIVYDTVSKTPIEGATVSIYQDLDASGTYNGADPLTPAYQKVTTSDGRYAWLTASNESYVIVVTPPSADYIFPSATILPTTAPDPLSAGLNDNDGLATGVYYTAFRFIASSGDLIGNDIPLDGPSGGSVLLSKAVNKREASIGDMVRYTLTLENTSGGTLSAIKVKDIIPAGFSYVNSSGLLTRTGNTAVPIDAIGQRPIEFRNISLSTAETITISYLLRISPGVVPAEYPNTASVHAAFGAQISNTAVRKIQIVLDPILQQSTLLGKVFHDVDGDGFQDPARATKVMVRGGVPSQKAYVPNTTTISRFGETPRRVDDVDGVPPLVQGIELGKIPGRRSTVDSITNHQIIIRSELNSPKLSPILVTSDEGSRIYVSPNSRLKYAHVDDKKKGLTGQNLVVSREIEQLGDRTMLKITVANFGIEEEGLPGVRMAMATGLVVISDAIGRFHVADVDGGRWDRGRNLVFKVDPMTLPLGTRFTTENPRIVRVTQGMATKLNFGVQLPRSTETHGYTPVTIGENAFDARTGAVKPDFAPSIQQLAEVITQQGGGRIVLSKDRDPRSSETSVAQTDSVENLQLSLQKYLRPDVLANITVVHDGSEHSTDPDSLPAFSNRHQLSVDDAYPLDLTGSWPLRIEGGGMIWATEDPAVTDPQLNILATENAQVIGNQIATPVRFRTYTNYGAFIDRWELVIRKASTITLPKVIRTIHGTGLSFSDPILWDGSVDVPAEFNAGDELQYLLRVYDSEGRMDETDAQALALVSAKEPSGDSATGFDYCESNAIPGLDIYGSSNLASQTIPIQGSRMRIQGKNISPNQRVFIAGERVPVNRENLFVIDKILPVGSYQIDIRLDDCEGHVWERHPDFDVEGTYYFLVGLTDLTGSVNSFSGNLESLGDDDSYDDTVSIDGRIAFYLKAKVKGKYLVTAQLDTREQSIGNLLRNIHRQDPQSMFRHLDPEKHYAVYGDGSTSYADVNTMGKFYVHVAWDHSQFLWGNYDTGFTGTELAQFNRSLYGAKVDYKSTETTKLGDHKTEFKAFASEAQTTPGHNEFVSTGGSLYYLKHKNIVPGSEKILVEVRDQNSGQVIFNQSLEVGTDYEIDDSGGRITLKRPLSQVTGDSAPPIIKDTPVIGNDVVLIADYEYFPSGTLSNDLTYGGRSKRWVTDNIAVGGTYVAEKRNGQDYRLWGTDVMVKSEGGSYLKAEFAQSDATQTLGEQSKDGGLSFSSLGSSTAAAGDATATSIEGGVDLAELTKGKLEGSATAFWKQRNNGFSTGTQDTTADTMETGVKLALKLNDKTTLRADATKSTIANGEDKLTLQLRADYEATDKLTLGAELKHDKTKPATGAESKGTVAGLRADYEVNDKVTVYGTGQATLSRSDGYEENNAVTLGAKVKVNDKGTVHGEVTTGTRGTGAEIGIDYQVTDSYSTYASYGVSKSRGGDTAGTLSFGSRSQLTDRLSLFQEDRYSHGGESGVARAMGLDYSVSDFWNVGFSMESSDLTESLNSSIERKAYSLSSDYSKDKFRITNKIELRSDGGATDTKQWLLENSVNYQWNEDLTLKGALNLSTSSVQGGQDARYTELDLGFAYRPADNDRWNLLGKYTYLSSLGSAGQSSTDTDERSHVLALESIYELNQRIGIDTKYALKMGEVRAGADSGRWYKTTTQLASVRARYHLTNEWEAYTQYSFLVGTESKAAKSGAQIGVYRYLRDGLKLGVGYNFTTFSDDLTNLDYDSKGAFINLVGALGVDSRQKRSNDYAKKKSREKPSQLSLRVVSIALEGLSGDWFSEPEILTVPIQLLNDSGLYTAPIAGRPTETIPLWALGGTQREGRVISASAMQEIVDAIANVYLDRNIEGTRITINREDLMRLNSDRSDGVLTIRIDEDTAVAKDFRPENMADKLGIPAAAEHDQPDDGATPWRRRPPESNEPKTKRDTGDTDPDPRRPDVSYLGNF